jgi:hypothetical protein
MYRVPTRPQHFSRRAGRATTMSSCWNRAGEQIRVGSRAVATEDDTSNGTVRKIADGDIAVIECDDGGEAWIPTPLLVAVKK